MATNSLIVFTDYDCPACRALAERLTRKDALLPFRYAVRNFPLPMHPRAYDAAVAAEEARLRGVFWQKHDALMKGNNAPPKKVRAAQSRSDEAGNVQSLHLHKQAQAAVENDLRMARDLKIDSTPSLFLVRGDGDVYRVSNLEQAQDLSR